jgi:hypothetical protein
MNVADYNAEFARCQRRMVWRMVYSIAIIFVALALANGVRYLGGDLADILAPIIIFAVGFPIMLLGFYHVDRTYRKFPALMCPHCDGNLSRARSVIIATGNCPSCGRRVLDDAVIGT